MSISRDSRNEDRDGWWVVLAWIAISLLPIQSAFAQSPATEMRQTGVQYVLLDNDRVLSGTVLVQGASVIIRRGNEAELILRADQIVAVADDLPQLYFARNQSAQRRSVTAIEGRLADVRWCIDQGLPAHATAALMSVYAEAPNHPVAFQLESRLRRLIEASGIVTASYTTDAGENTTTGEDVIQAVSHAAAKSADPPAAVEADVRVNATTAPASLHAFTARVQPILISRCASCHNDQAEHKTKWNLVLPPGGAVRVTQRGSLANLQATIPFCDSRSPQNSELIIQAMSNHSGSESEKPPIAAHERSLIYTLHEWISFLEVTSKPNSIASPTMTSTELAESDIGYRSEPLSPIEPTDVASSLVSPPNASDAARGDEPPRRDHSNRPTRLPVVENPNSVEQFNRETMLRRRFGLK